MESVTSRDGVRMPSIGLGTWQSKAGEVENAVTSAIESGCRLFDCAFVYLNEKEVGAALEKNFTSGNVKREDVFVITKLWNTFHRKEHVRAAVLASLENLRLTYLDLYLIHWPHAFQAGENIFPKDSEGNVLYDDVDYLETWKALEGCVKEGLIRAIGLSNFNSQQVQRVTDNAEIKPANIQIEVNPYFGQQKLVPFCLERGLTVTAYSPFGSPARPWVTAGEPSLLDEPVLVDIAKQHGKTPAQVFDFVLSAESMTMIDAMDRNQRVVVPTIEVNGERVMRDRFAPHFPFNAEF